MTLPLVNSTQAFSAGKEIMARKVFTAGSVLNAADVNTYLMDQAVMTFADSTARSSAIASPTNGMFTFLTGSESLEYYDGAGWVSVNNSTINTQSGTAYTLTANDAGKLIQFTSSSAVTLTIGTALLPGQKVDIVQDGAGTVTWAAGGGTVNAWNSATKLRGQYAAATIYAIGSASYRVVGNIA
jgi:hypothetical protein